MPRKRKSKRSALWAKNAAGVKRRRAELVRLLSPDLTCNRCGAACGDPSELVVDHVDGKAWRASKLSSSMRVARYRREYDAGVPLRAICHECSERDGAHRRNGTSLDAVEGVPF